MSLEHGFLGKENKVLKIEDPIKERNKMFEKVLEELRTHKDTMNASVTPVSFIFRNSVQDGLEFARKAGLTPSEIYKATLDNHLFWLAHRRLMNRVFEKGADMDIDSLHHNEDILDRSFSDKTDRAELTPEGTSLFEAHLPWQDQEIGDDPEIYKIIENHYREFLPYRANQLKESIEEAKEKAESKRREELRKKGIKEKPSPEEMRAEHIKKSENILLGKYLNALEQDVFSEGEVTDREELEERIHQALPEKYDSRIIFELTEALLAYHEGKKSEEVLPTFFMKQGGQEFTWDLEAARKPVAKIIENISAKKLREDLEHMCNEFGYRQENQESYKVVFDQVLNRHIATKQPFHRPGIHESAEEILAVQPIIHIFNELFLRHPINLENFSLEQAEQEIEECFEADSELQERFRKAKNAIDGFEFDDYGPIESVIGQFCKDASPATKSYLEALAIKARIKEGRLEDVSKYLVDARERVNGSVLTDSQISNLLKWLSKKFLRVLRVQVWWRKMYRLNAT